MDFSQVEDLRRRLLAGENRVYKEILEDCGSYCINRLIRKTSCPYEDAEDILMEAILVFRENMLSGKIQMLSSIRAYVFAICWNKWQEQYRNIQKHQKAVSTIRTSWYTEISIDQDNTGESKNSPSQEAPLDRYRKLSQKALNLLGEKCKSMLEYFYQEEKTMVEIADVMGYANAQTAKNLKARCYKRWVQIARELSQEENLEKG